nr:MAG TPA: hypothetical protein [Caudoviricetes sp.]
MATERRIACPLCRRKDFKDKLIRHIEKDHEDIIGEISAEQFLYDKTHPGSGKCIVCGNKTEWNEKTGKYHRLCSNPRCKEEMRAKFKKNMIRVHGKVSLLDDAAHQAKMLANRSISGTYVYSDGTKFTYTGSYEHKAIEFMDKVLNCNSKDIIMPGPVIDYTDQYGNSRQWITDIYYVPYNLIIEVKDGGDNPNNRQMDEYRAKQVSKEAELIKLGEYNYLRLVDNKFVQLMEVLALLKDQEINEPNTTNKVIRINESAVYDDGGFILSNMEEFEEDTDKGKYIFTVDASNIACIKSVLPKSYPDNIKYIDLNKILNYLFYNTFVDNIDADDITEKMVDQYFANVYPNVDRKDIFPNANTEDLNLNMTIDEVYAEIVKMIRYFFFARRGENKTIFILDRSLYSYLIDQYHNLIGYATMYFGTMAIAVYKTYAAKKIPQEYDIIRRLSDLKEYAAREHMGVGAVGGIVGTMDGNMLVQYTPHKHSFSGEKDGFGIVDDKKSTKLRVKSDNEETEIVDKEPFLQDKFYKSYRHKRDRVTWENAINLYEEITGKVMLSRDQLEYDDDFIEADLDRENKLALMNMVYSIESDLYNTAMPLCDILEVNTAKSKLKEFPEGTMIMEDYNGYFAIDLESGVRSKSYDIILEIEAPAFVKAKDALTQDDDTQSTNNKKVKEVNDSGMYKVLDDKYSSEEQLMDDWNDYNSLSADMKRHSDDMSIEIYGKSNIERFKELRSKYLNSEIPYDDLALSESGLQLSDLDRARDYGIELRGKKREIEYLQAWSLNSGIFVILPCDSEEELDAQWNNLQSMDISLIRISDMRMMEAFGCNNETMYNFLKSIFTNKGFDDFYYFPMVESAMEDVQPIRNLPNTTPFYIPHEIEVFKRNSTFGDMPSKWKSKADQWLKDYKNIYEGKSYDKKVILDWMSNVRYLSLEYTRTQSDEYKQALLEFGWNPYMEFNPINMNRAHNRANTLYHRSMTAKLLQEKGIGFEFDNKGNLFVKNFLKNKNYQATYMESHRLLMEYDRAKNIEAMKYELAKMYYLNLKITEDLTKEDRTKKDKELVKIRARVLNDFHKYLKVVLKNDRQFNFSNYYQRSEFCDDSFVITAPTLKHAGRYAKIAMQVL